MTVASTMEASHSELIKSAVHAITTNQDNVLKGFKDVVEDHHRKSLKRKTLFRFVKYIVLFLVILVVALVIDFFVKDLRLHFVLLALVAVFVISAISWAIYIRCGKSRKIMNWRLRIASRYLPICQVSQHYMELMIPTLSSEVKEICHCQLAGSSGDSFGFFPSYSANVSAINLFTPVPFTQDVDMNLFYDALVLSERNLAEIGQPGFCWVQINKADIPQESFIRDCIVQLHNMTYLSGKLVSDKIGSYIPTGVKNIEYNYPAITYKTDIGGPQGRFKFDVDVVFGIKLNLWPSIAKDWPARVDGKLPADLIESIQSRGCYIVHKHCNGADLTSDHQDHNLDWRITFAEAESKLFNYHSSKEALKLCYVILKFFIKFYSAKQKTVFSALKSYHLKTVFLHFAEEEDQLYNMDVIKPNNHLSDIFHLLIEKYINALETKSLPHYFMPSVNILGQYSDKQIKAGLKMLKELQRKPIWVVDLFDSAWLNSKKFITFFLVLIVLAIVAQAGRLFFSARTTYLNQDSDKSFLDLVGEENRDLVERTRDHDTRLKFLNCMKDNYAKLLEEKVLLPFEKTISFCRESLGLLKES